MKPHQEDEILGVLDRVTGGLERLGIRFFLTGSFASGVHGVYRQTAGLDLVAAFGEGDVGRLVAEFSGEFYLAEAAIRRSLTHGTAFNLIHLAKLAWYRAGGERSERQWGDVLGVLRTLGEDLDRNYLVERSRTLDLEELLRRAIQEAED